MDRLASILMLRARLVHLPDPVDGPGDPELVRTIEVDLAATGWLLSGDLSRRLIAIGDDEARRWADWMLATAESELGSDRSHVPLFRGFPKRVPNDLDRLYIDRLLVFLLQEPDQPCLLCGTVGSVQQVHPCGHPVCWECFGREDYSACPICNQRIDGASTFVDPPALSEIPFRLPMGVPLRTRRLALGVDAISAAVRLRDDLVARTSPLGSADLEDLGALIDATAEGADVSWLPPGVASRQTLAFVTGRALRLGGDQGDLSATARRWETATDVARAVWVMSGHSPDLVLPRDRDTRRDRLTWLSLDRADLMPSTPRIAQIGRPIRRAVLARLNDLALERVIEDQARHATVWKRLGERLHPFEHARQFPSASVAFAALRGSSHPVDSDVGRAILDAGSTLELRPGWTGRSSQPT